MTETLIGGMTRSKKNNDYKKKFQSKRKSADLKFAILNPLTLDISDAITLSKLEYHECLMNRLNDSKTHNKPT